MNKLIFFIIFHLFLQSSSCLTMYDTVITAVINFFFNDDKFLGVIHLFAVLLLLFAVWTKKTFNFVVFSAFNRNWIHKNANAVSSIYRFLMIFTFRSENLGLLHSSFFSVSFAYTRQNVFISFTSALVDQQHHVKHMWNEKKPDNRRTGRKKSERKNKMNDEHTKCCVNLNQMNENTKQKKRIKRVKQNLKINQVTAQTHHTHANKRAESIHESELNVGDFWRSGMPRNSK